MRTFVLQRDVDVSGVSGTGIVAEGVEFQDGPVAIRWIAGDHRSTVIWPDMAGVEAIHGHGGATRIVWSTGLDEVEVEMDIEAIVKAVQSRRPRSEGGTTEDPGDPRLKEIRPDGQQATYLVLSAEERSKGFVQPLRHSYRHVGPAGPVYPLRDLDPEELERFADAGYVKFEEYLRSVPADAPYPPFEDGGSSVRGRYWTQEQLAMVGRGCGVVTTMSQAIAETYARDPQYYSGTFCAGCRTHLPVGRDGEFIWDDGSGHRVGTIGPVQS